MEKKNQVPAETMRAVKLLLEPYGVNIEAIIEKPKKMLRPKQVAELLGCTTNHVRCLVKCGRITAYKPADNGKGGRGHNPGAIYIDCQSVYDYLESGKIFAQN